MSAFLSFFSKTKEVDICVRSDITEIDFYKAMSIQPNLNWNEEETRAHDFSHNRELCSDSLEKSKVSGCFARLPYYLALNSAEVKINANMDQFHCFPERGCAK
uniref:Uncharacterized protein n=1 Tax=Ditylenchus dipsaci TaxID=166011 RepID=A0A915DIF0_9BILA